MAPTRRDLLKTGAAVAAAAAAPRTLAQSPGGSAGGTFYEKGDVRIRYLDTGGSGFPLLIIPGGGLNSTITGLINSHPFNAIDEFKNEFRCITCDLRNANAGESTGPLEVDRPWDAFTDDHIGVMDHLGIDKFMVLGFCIGGPFIWNLLERAPNRVVAAVTAQPSGYPARAAHALLRQQHGGLGARDREAPARDHDGDGRPVPDAHVQDERRLRVHGDARLRAPAAKRPCSCCPTTSRRIRTPSRWRP